MNYKDYLSSEPVAGQQFPYNTIEFFDDNKMTDAYYIDPQKLKNNGEDDIAEIVDNYLNDHINVTRAVAYRVESQASRFAYQEFGRD